MQRSPRQAYAAAAVVTRNGVWKEQDWNASLAQHFCSKFAATCARLARARLLSQAACSWNEVTSARKLQDGSRNARCALKDSLREFQDGAPARLQYAVSRQSTSAMNRVEVRGLVLPGTRAHRMTPVQKILGDNIIQVSSPRTRHCVPALTWDIVVTESQADRGRAEARVARHRGADD